MKGIFIMIDYVAIGNRLKLRREEKNLTQTELSSLTGFSNNHISTIELGKAHPSIEFIVQTAIALGTTPDFFLLGNLHGGNTSQDIIDMLKLCSEEQLKYIKLFIILVTSNMSS